MKWQILWCILTLASVHALAAERYEFYNGIRGLGMGGAHVATVNDETALVINPAGLGKLRDYYITIIDPEIDVGAETEQIAGTDILNMIKPQDALDKANANPDKFMHLRGNVFPSIVVPNFGFGLLMKYEVNSELVSETNLFKYDYRDDYAAVFGFNFRLFNGIVKLGANTRVVNRTEIRRDDIDPLSTGLERDTLASEGVGVGSDVGLLIAAPIAWIPTLGVVYRDAGSTSYKLRGGMFSNTDERPDRTPATLDVGLAIHPILGKRFRSTWTVEFRDSMATEETSGTDNVDDPMRRFHAGVEFNYADALFLRGGMNQRYYTAGLELAIINYQFQAATYGEEIGTADENREDRRYVVKFSFRF